MLSYINASHYFHKLLKWFCVNWLSLFPILFLYNINLDIFEIQQIKNSLIILLVLNNILLFLFLFLNKTYFNAKLTVITVPIIVYLLFCYTFFYTNINFILIKIVHVKHQYFIFIYLFIIILFVYFLNLFKKYIIIFLLLINSINFALLTYRISSKKTTFSSSRLSINEINNSKQVQKSYIKNPDIYYFILDMYPSGEILNSVHNFNNIDFINSLKLKGFKVFDNSKSNYNRTILSLNSTMNYEIFNYNISGQNLNLTSDSLKYSLDNNKVFKYLITKGYSIYTFEGGYFNGSQMCNIINLKYNNSSYKTEDDINMYMLSLTILQPFLERINYTNIILLRQRFYNIVDHILQLNSIPANKFVVAHVMIPHPPYIFNKSGNIPANVFKQEFDSKMFTNQLFFLNIKLDKIINEIVKSSKDKEKIIIIQGDHGSRRLKKNTNYSFSENWCKEHFGNFNCIYFSNSIYKNQYNIKSNVNTFPALFNILFNDSIKMSKDDHYYSDLTFPIKLFEVK